MQSFHVTSKQLTTFAPFIHHMTTNSMLSTFIFYMLYVISIQEPDEEPDIKRTVKITTVVTQIPKLYKFLKIGSVLFR